MGLGVAASGCSSNDNSFTIVDSDAGPTVVHLSDGGTATLGKLLISSAATTANAQCPDGGTTINVGYDTNGNGTLDPSEITSSQEVCTVLPTSTSSDAGTRVQVLTTLTTSSGDDMCANGGTIIKSGADTNGNGILDPGEVTSTQEICGGGSDVTLSVSTAIPIGSAICPLGGTETQSGLDNGAGGGTAGDGILQPGEISSTINVCTQAANASNYFVQSFTPPAAAPNQPASAINLNGGGSATAAGGGVGGAFSVAKTGTLGGHLKLFKTGQANAAFTMPTLPTPNYGTGKVLDVSAATSPITVTETPTVGSFYVNTSTQQLQYDDPANANTVVTGIHVEAGQVLIFDLPGVILTSVQNDIVIEGTIDAMADATTGNASSVYLLSTDGNAVGGSGATLNANGAVGAPGAPGGTGGFVVLAGVSVYNQATINASGGAGGTTAGGGAQAGGSAGIVELYATSLVGYSRANPIKVSSVLYNTGTITANGGDATLTAGATNAGANGGAAPEFAMAVGYGNLYNSGSVTVHGGKGVGTGNGGAGTPVCEIIQGYSTTGQPSGRGSGSLVNSGAFDVSAGDADVTCTGAPCGRGPSGGHLDIQHAGGDLVWSGAITANGGASASLTSPTGSGGAINVSSYEGYNAITNAESAFGNVTFSGTISANGGAPTGSAVGGSGGSFTLTQDTSLSTSTGQEIQFLGYTNLNANGGDAVGTSLAGAGGTVDLQVNESNATGNGANVLHATGSVINYLDIAAYGGMGAATSATSGGGNGGSVTMQSNEPNSTTDDDDGQFIINTGMVDVYGGNGSLYGGGIGAILFSANDGITNSGAITGTGGSTTAAGGVAGGYLDNGNILTFIANGGILSNTAAINFSGGNATAGSGTTTGGSFLSGSNLGSLRFTSGSSLINSGAITASGGSSVGNNGGAGATIVVTSSGTVANTGVFTALGGASTGGSAGANGVASINGVVQP